MIDKEKRDARFLMDGVTCDPQIEEAKKRIQEMCKQAREEKNKK